MHKVFPVLSLFFGTIFLPVAASASAIEFGNAPIAHDSQLSLGFVFTTNEEIRVTSLGYYDENQDGFLADHEVGIFDGNGNLLVSTVLAAGSGSTLQGHYRYQAITPFVLTAGSSFTIAGTTGGFSDGWIYGNPGSTISGFVVDPRISVAPGAARFSYQNDNVLRMPSDEFGYTIYGGPNFLLAPADVTGVPEPGSAALALSGFAILMYASKKRISSRL
jgi:hypothetical protein